jgi:GT2 family glycosyltransferase
VIIILGAHSEAADDFVAANVATLARTGAAAAGGPIETAGEGAVGRAIAAALSHPFGVGDARFRYAHEEGETDTIAFAAYRRECFDILGGFDPERVDAEDGHFNYRIRAAGGRLYLDPAIRSRYHGAAGYRALWRQYFRYGKGKGRAIVFEPRFARPRHLVPALVVAGGGALALASLRSRRARRLLMTLGGLYWSLAQRSGRRASGRSGNGRLAPLTTLAFPVMHLAYGIGSILGIARGLARP